MKELIEMESGVTKKVDDALAKLKEVGPLLKSDAFTPYLRDILVTIADRHLEECYKCLDRYIKTRFMKRYWSYRLRKAMDGVESFVDNTTKWEAEIRGGFLNPDRNNKRICP